MKIKIPQWLVDTIEYPQKLYESIVNDKSRKSIKNKKQLYKYVSEKTKKLYSSHEKSILNVIPALIGISMVFVVANTITSAFKDQLGASGYNDTSMPSVITALNFIPIFTVIAIAMITGMIFFNRGGE